MCRRWPNTPQTLPYVEFAADNLYSCSQDTQETMAQIIKEKKLNRVVVAACTPKTHEPLFQETLVNAGLNKYLFEMANIRNQDSWVHRNNPDLATQKAKDLVRMAVSKAALMEPLQEAELSIAPKRPGRRRRHRRYGGGPQPSPQGYETHIIERKTGLAVRPPHISPHSQRRGRAAGIGRTDRRDRKRTTKSTYI